MALADGSPLAGEGVEYRDRCPLAVKPVTRQPCAVRAHDDGRWLFGPRHHRVTKDSTRFIEQVKARIPDPCRDPQTAARLGGGDITMPVRADWHGPGLAAFIVRDTQAGGGHCCDTEAVRSGEQSPVGKGNDRQAVVEPAVQVPPLPVAEFLRGRLQVAFCVGHVVPGQCGGCGRDAGPIGLEPRLARLVIGPPLVFPGHAGVLVRADRIHD
jgi:hypothetical protein